MEKVGRRELVYTGPYAGRINPASLFQRIKPHGKEDEGVNLPQTITRIPQTCGRRHASGMAG